MHFVSSILCFSNVVDHHLGAYNCHIGHQLEMGLCLFLHHNHLDVVGGFRNWVFLCVVGDYHIHHLDEGEADFHKPFEEGDFYQHHDHDHLDHHACDFHMDHHHLLNCNHHHHNHLRDLVHRSLNLGDQNFHGLENHPEEGDHEGHHNHPFHD